MLQSREGREPGGMDISWLSNRYDSRAQFVGALLSVHCKKLVPGKSRLITRKVFGVATSNKSKLLGY